MPHERPRAFPARRRLRRPDEFAAVLAARGPASLRLARRWFAVSVLALPRGASAAELDPVRFGFTVGKRNARRAVDRNLVKRVLRESARHAFGQFATLAHERGLGLAVSLRLKAPLVPKGAAVARGELSRALRADCDALLTDLARHLPRLSLEATDA
ncbi:MAG TPA: ribonuclease P protein component [Burkholderiaceae bacterium]|nr:ribonuclease P protein component [Burkholderiaceae bacterium]HPE01378.1 ribonuclease P protein component [Burkholderiaceae bacterium]HRZ00517.1 ribonuclease P protein component [Burkholderiaceae bacterium]